MCIQSTTGTRQLISCTSIIISVYFNLQLMLIALRKSEYCHSSFVVAISNHAEEICPVLKETANVTCVKVKWSREVSDKISLHFFSMSHFLSFNLCPLPTSISLQEIEKSLVGVPPHMSTYGKLLYEVNILFSHALHTA